jgi:hypothetical protein
MASGAIWSTLSMLYPTHGAVLLLINTWHKIFLDFLAKGLRRTVKPLFRVL